MATKFLEENILQKMERLAQATVTKRKIVKLNADYLQVNLAVANDIPFGVSLNDALAGESVQVAVQGSVYIDAGGTIVAGDEIVADAAGKAVARGTTATVLYKVIGKAITGAASGEQVSVQLGQYNVWGANAS